MQVISPIPKLRSCRPRAMSESRPNLLNYSGVSPIQILDFGRRHENLMLHLNNESISERCYSILFLRLLSFIPSSTRPYIHVSSYIKYELLGVIIDAQFELFYFTCGRWYGNYFNFSYISTQGNSLTPLFSHCVCTSTISNRYPSLVPPLSGTYNFGKFVIVCCVF